MNRRSPSLQSFATWHDQSHENAPWCKASARQGSVKLSELPCPTEHEEQVMLVRWAAAITYKFPELAGLAAVPNGGDRHPAVAGKLALRAARRLPGSDPRRRTRWLPRSPHIEMKRRRGG